MKRILSSLILLYLLTGCAMQKMATQKQEADESESMRSVHERVDSAIAENSYRMKEEILEQRSLRMETITGIPPSETSLNLTMENLLDLPEGAEFTSRQGRAAISVTKSGNSLKVSGRCDSIARRCIVLETESFRQKIENDSLRQELSQMHSILDSVATSARSNVISMENETKKRGSGWFIWLTSGFIIGISVSLALKTIRKKLII